MAKLTIEEILAAIDELTVIELNDLVKAAEEKYGVSAAQTLRHYGYRWGILW